MGRMISLQNHDTPRTGTRQQKKKKPIERMRTKKSCSKARNDKKRKGG